MDIDLSGVTSIDGDGERALVWLREAEINQHPSMGIATTAANRPQASICCPNSVSAFGMSGKACLGVFDQLDL
jgi:hypothetical protein